MAFNPKSLKNLKIPKKGDPSPNPSGGPSGKKISAWMIELGQKTRREVQELYDSGTLATNGLIAAARLLKSASFDGVRDTEVVLDRTEGKVEQKYDGKFEGTIELSWSNKTSVD